MGFEIDKCPGYYKNDQDQIKEVHNDPQIPFIVQEVGSVLRIKCPYITENRPHLCNAPSAMTSGETKTKCPFPEGT